MSQHCKFRQGFLATAAIGYLGKHNATLSSAEGGCQAEIGVASAMSAAFIAQACDRSPQTIEDAAESALEHHLGLTCDPVAGYVQVPCIERCAFGAVKAWTTYMIASNEIEARHRVDLDTTIETMAETGRDMGSKYKETSEDGLVIDYETTGDFPKFGNNDPRVDGIAADLAKRFMGHLRKNAAYRGATHTQSVLTITSNVVYGKNTGNTPDGRRAGEPFAPGANPMHGRDSHGWLASCLSVARLPYDEAQDGISYTLSVVPQSTRQGEAEAITRAIGALDTFFGQGGFHMNLNVLSKDTLLDAMENPDKYPSARGIQMEAARARLPAR